MSLLEIGRTGASKQSWRSPAPRALLKALMDDAKDPHDSKAIYKLFLSVVIPVAVSDAFDSDDERARLTTIIEYWFTNNYNSLAHLFPRKGEERLRKIAQQKRIAKEAAIRTALRERIQDEAELLLLDWVMPNGKAMGDCTGKEIRDFGRKVAPWLTKIAARVKPTEIVRDVLNETDVRKMWDK